MKRYFVCALLISLLQNNIVSAETKSLSRRFAISASHSIGGLIQFPTSLNTLPKFPLYCSGKKLSTELDQSKNTIHYTAPKGSYQVDFYLIITPSIEFELLKSKDNTNTVDYLKIPGKQKYKCFYTYLIPVASNKNSSSTQADTPFEWVIEEKTIEDSGRIPDNAIILICDPDFVESIQAGNYRDLPLIKMRTDLVQFAGSEAKIHDQLNAILLGSIDIDTIHATTRQEQCIKISHNKVLIPAITT